MWYQPAPDGQKSVRHLRVQMLVTLLVTVMIAVVAFTVEGIQKVREHMKNVVSGKGALLSAVVEMDRNLLEGQLALNSAWTADDQDEIRLYSLNFTANTEELQIGLGQYQRTMRAEPDCSEMLTALSRSVREWQARSAALMEGLLRKTPREQLEADNEVVLTQFARARQLLADLENGYHKPRSNESGNALIEHAGALQIQIVSTIVVGLVIGVFAGLSIRRILLNQEAALCERLREQQRGQTQREFDRRVQNALAMAPTQDAVLSVVTGAIEENSPGTSISVLLADSSRAHLTQAVATSDAADRHMCSVPTPNDCPAVRRGSRVLFANSAHFDACPQLKNRPGEPLSAVCIPISAMGHSIGVLHVCGKPDQQPDAEFLENLTLLASRAGDRIGMLRAFAQTELQATTDPLTGLLNRRSLEARIQGLSSDGSSYCVVYTDIDHFKRLNDQYGHDTGDRALRLFSETLRNSVRPSDWVARWGGEEFIILLPNASVSDALQVLRRIQEALARAVSAGNVPTFTASFGLAGPCSGTDFHARLELADEALLLAKRNGRNRVEVCSAELQPVTPAGDPALNIELPPPAEPVPDGAVAS